MSKPRHYKDGFWKKRDRMYAEIQFVPRSDIKISPEEECLRGEKFICRIGYASLSLYLRMNSQHRPLGVYMKPIGESAARFERIQRAYLDDREPKNYQGQLIEPREYISMYTGMFIRDVPQDEGERVIKNYWTIKNAKRKISLDD